MRLRRSNLSAEDFFDIASKDGFRIHFGQFAEDAFIVNFFNQRRDGFYVDVGCHHPTRLSNTYLLHRVFGWRGVNIDANEQSIKQFNRARPDDINIVAAISDVEEEHSFFTFKSAAVNTLDPKMAEKQRSSFAFSEEKSVVARRLDSILSEVLSEGEQVDYLNVDCEGFDVRVLQSNDWTRWRPALVSVELHDFNIIEPMSHPAVAYLHSVGYALRSFQWVTGLFARREATI